MQKRKIEDSKIREAYNRIISGESLTKVASDEDIKLDRGTLRTYIEAVVLPELNEEEKEKFEQAMHGNFRGNSTEKKRENRIGVRRRATEDINNSEQIEILTNLGVTPDQVERLFLKLRTHKKTIISKDTYIFKCIEHLKVLNEFGFTTDDVFEIFTKRPKLFAGSPNHILRILEQLAETFGSMEAAMIKFRIDPWIDLRLGKPKEEEQPEERGDE